MEFNFIYNQRITNNVHFYYVLWTTERKILLSHLAFNGNGFEYSSERNICMSFFMVKNNGSK